MKEATQAPTEQEINLQATIQAAMTELQQANAKIINLRTELLLVNNELKQYKDRKGDAKEAPPEKQPEKKSKKTASKKLPGPKKKDADTQLTH